MIPLKPRQSKRMELVTQDSAEMVTKPLIMEKLQWNTKFELKTLDQGNSIKGSYSIKQVEQTN